MNVSEWLLKGDDSVQFLVNKNLLSREVAQDNHGYIARFLDAYNKESKMWGGGLYGPKWISSTYTLLDLIDLEAAIDKRMIDAYFKLRKEIVIKYSLNPEDKHTLDLCIVGMLIKIGSYIKVEQGVLKKLIDYILYTINSDGAWNCYYNYRDYHTSSLHTTMNVLEGLHEYMKQGYAYRKEEVYASMVSANEFMLKKSLFRSRRTNKIISQHFMSIHYPTRWYYDMFRAMEYFADSDVPYDKRMSETLEIIKKMISKGPLVKGRSYAGQMHFKFSLNDYKRINTYRMLKVIKKYDDVYFEKLMLMDDFA